MVAPELVLYARDGCHLCAEMESLLQEFSADYTYTVNVIDIDADPQLRERFNVLVPALYLDGQEVCHHFLDLQRLTEMLAGQVQLAESSAAEEKAGH